MVVRCMTSAICRRKVVCGILIVFVIYLLIRIKEYTVKYDGLVPKSKPMEVWEFVSDFSNMLRLNPTIIDFHIQEESGDYRSWYYSLTYTEHLSHLPFVHNFGFAEYLVKSIGSNIFVIESSHRTCFLTTYTCLNSWSTFKFEPKDEYPMTTLCSENVTYECPVFLSFLCQKEVIYQRRTIFTNLQNEFAKPRPPRRPPIEPPTNLPPDFLNKHEEY